MNVTTKKSECDPKQQVRQLEVAIEHATAAAQAASGGFGGSSPMSIEVRYPSYQFRETLKALGLDVEERTGRWLVVSDKILSLEASTAACRVLRHYYPDEDFVIVSEVDEPALNVTGER